mgnify:CR=1 FL=1
MTLALRDKEAILDEEIQDIEWLKCQQSCLYFLTKYAYIQNFSDSRREKWQAYPYLCDITRVSEETKDLIVLKARQLGLSWLFSGISLWKAMFSEMSRVMFISENEAKAWDMLAKSKYMWENLPDWMRIDQKNPDSKALLNFKSHHSYIEAIPCTENAGRGSNATLVVRDEVAFQEYAAQNFVSLGPSIDAGKAKLVDISTINVSDVKNHFTERVNRAMAGAVRTDMPSGLTVFRGGESGATLVFAGVHLRPDREDGKTFEEWWDLRIVPKYTDIVREKEYARTIEDVLKPVQSRAFLDVKATEDMLKDILNPYETVKGLNTHNGIVKVYKLPQIGRRYCVFTDPSDGVVDPFHTVVLDVQTGEGVCEAEGKMVASECAGIHDEIARFYNNASNTWDANSFSGGKFSETINALDTPNQAARRDFTKEGFPVQESGEGKLGWAITEPLRKAVLSGLQDAVYARAFITHNKTSVQQFQAFYVPEGGRPQMPGGMHDDALMAWGCVWQLRRCIPRGAMKVVTSKYKD